MKFEALIRQTKKQYADISVRKEHMELSAALKKELLEELTASPYQLPQVRSFMESATEHCVFRTSSITLHWISPACDIPEVFLERVVRRVQCLAQIYAIRPLEFWLIPCPIPKTMPRPHEHVTQKNMNGGYTYPANGKVYIYRFEEFPKVMIHETLHHSPMDIRTWNAKSLKALYTFFHIRWDASTHILPNEAVVETWAEVYQLIFLSIDTGVPFQMLWEKELQSAILQAAKLLRFQENHVPLWEETTHSFSYIVLRAILLWNIERFLELPIPYSSEKVSALMMEGFQTEAFQQGLQYAMASRAMKGSSLRMTRFGDF